MQEIEKDKLETEKTEKIVTHILEEARMILPGIQALLGFQLIAVFNATFKNNLPLGEQYLHIAAIFFSLNSICLLMTPAAVHRISEPNNTSKEFAKLTGFLVAAGMIPLLLSFCLDLYLVANIVSENKTFSLLITMLIAFEFTFFWFIMPFLRKSRNLFQ